MTPVTHVEVRPRTTGEILDDAWRAYLTDAPLLLTLTGLFGVPASVVLLLILTQPEPSGAWQRLALPALAATLLPLTGLGSCACQYLLRRRTDEAEPSLQACLGAGLRQGWPHVAARALVLLAVMPQAAANLAVLTSGMDLVPLLGVVIVTNLLLGVPTAVILMGCAALHPLLATGDSGLRRAILEAWREAHRQPGKVAALVFGFGALFVVAVFNLHALFQLCVWIGENLAGLDLALAGILLSFKNPVYVLELVLLVGWLMAPLAEVAGYLFHVDAKTRYEGLDLWVRVQRLFVGQGKIVAGLLLAAVTLLPFGSLQAAEDPLVAIGNARREIARIRGEIKNTNPYPGSARWAPALLSQADRLEDAASTAGKSRYRWFRKSLEGFSSRNREGALYILTDLEERLTLLEENLQLKPSFSKDDIKKALGPEANDAAEEADARATPPPPKPEKRQPPPEEIEIEGERHGGGGPGLLPAQPAGGFEFLGWMILGGALLAVLLLAGFLFWQRWKLRLRRRNNAPTGTLEPSLEAIVTQPDQHSVAGLWSQADSLARDGNYRDAVRMVYLAVLALLHRSNFIRFERTRTNGEYAQQLRPHQELHEPFRTMTGLFEMKWYSESACQADDYQAVRGLAAGMQDVVQEGLSPRG
jgi:hypothetical protein